jgi:hypothetical protein
MAKEGLDAIFSLSCDLVTNGYRLELDMMGSRSEGKGPAANRLAPSRIARYWAIGRISAAAPLIVCLLK